MKACYTFSLLLLLLAGCGRQPTAVDGFGCRLLAAHWLAYAAQASQAEASPALVGKSAAADPKPGWLKSWAADVARIAREDFLRESQLSMADIRNWGATIKRLDAWMNAFPPQRPRVGRGEAIPSDAITANPQVRLVVITAETCEPCHRLLKELRERLPEGWQLNATIAADVQVLDQEQQAEQVRGYRLPARTPLPVLLLVKPDGNWVARRSGSLSAAACVAWLQEARR